MSTPLIVQFLLCPLVFYGALRTTAPYGRHHREGWGPGLPGRTAWVLMELPALLVISLLVGASGAILQPQAWVPLAFWVFHYGYRTLLFPALMRPSQKPFPAVLVLSGIGFNLLNGYNNAQALIDSAKVGDHLMSAHFFTGSVMFLAGFVMHYRSDATIRSLRKPGSSAYRIPNGGLFRWVSSPHYLGEIVQWCGWALMTWSLAGLAFALFTFCNLAPRAIANHRWYRETFPDYPGNRKVLIPGVF
jgi:3-oxo-5-alpha-steroid 4-dehydrogenase 1